MAGEKLPLGIISANFVGTLVSQLKGTSCFVVTKDTKVRSGLGVISSTSYKGMYSYPDILVICGKPDFIDEHQDVISNPTVIIEVLSQSTESFDRGEKFHRYSSWNPTLKEYLLVTQNKPHVDHFIREAEGNWLLKVHVGLEAVIPLQSISCQIKLADIYDRVEFSKETE
jgi:Uma2 family endonuclease